MLLVNPASQPDDKDPLRLEMKRLEELLAKKEEKGTPLLHRLLTGGAAVAGAFTGGNLQSFLSGVASGGAGAIETGAETRRDEVNETEEALRRLREFEIEDAARRAREIDKENRAFTAEPAEEKRDATEFDRREELKQTNKEEFEKYKNQLEPSPAEQARIATGNKNAETSRRREKRLSEADADGPKKITRPKVPILTDAVDAVGRLKSSRTAYQQAKERANPEGKLTTQALALLPDVEKAERALDRAVQPVNEFADAYNLSFDGAVGLLEAVRVGRLTEQEILEILEMMRSGQMDPEEINARFRPAPKETAPQTPLLNPFHPVLDPFDK
jgi:hypothetical protein